jgi:hypothetical protein
MNRQYTLRVSTIILSLASFVLDQFQHCFWVFIISLCVVLLKAAFDYLSFTVRCSLCNQLCRRTRLYSFSRSQEIHICKHCHRCLEFSSRYA